eukprot:586594-Amphidinium_carterae.1
MSWYSFQTPVLSRLPWWIDSFAMRPHSISLQTTSASVPAASSQAQTTLVPSGPRRRSKAVNHNMQASPPAALKWYYLQQAAFQHAPNQTVTFCSEFGQHQSGNLSGLCARVAWRLFKRMGDVRKESDDSSVAWSSPQHSAHISSSTARTGMIAKRGQHPTFDMNPSQNTCAQCHKGYEELQCGRGNSHL